MQCTFIAKEHTVYTLPDTCTLLSINYVTLYRWIRRAKIELVHGEADRRFRYLKPEDVEHLAREHHRVIGSPEVGKLAVEVAELRRQIGEIKGA
jgi:predicted site-specific integrase-resolvase